MSIPYCLDDCGFVVEPEVRQVDSSSSILLSQEALAIQSFLHFGTNYEIICSPEAVEGRLLCSWAYYGLLGWEDRGQAPKRKADCHPPDTEQDAIHSRLG